MNQSKNVLADAIVKYFGADLADKRQSIKTDLVDQKIIGAISARTNIAKSKYCASLKANKANSSILHTILKAGNGTLSLNTLFPFQDVQLNRRATAVNTVNLFVMTAASSGEYERSVNASSDAPKSLVYGNGNIAALGRLFASERLNGADLRGDITTTYIPTLPSIWNGPYFEPIGGREITVGQAINIITLKIWKNLQATLASEALTEVDKQEAYTKAWNTYQNLYNVWISKGYVDMSTVLYAKPNGIKPDVAAYLGTTSTSDELNVQKIMGTSDGRTSSVPEMNEGNFHAIILDDEHDEYGKHQFGIFKLATLSAENHDVLEDDEEISKTPEIASRAIQIFDGAGKSLKARVRVVDQVFGSSKPVKTSRSFYNLAVGTVVHLQGNIHFRTLKEGSQAVVAEIEVEDFMASTVNQNMILGDILTSDTMEDFDLSSLTSELDFVPTNQDPVPTEQVPVPSDTQSDDEMNG